MAPLVLLLGRNNTGKSYVATLAWAISNASALFSSDEARERRPPWFADAAKQLQQDTIRLEVGESRAQELIEYFNNELALNGSQLLRDVFAFDGFKKTSVTVAGQTPFEPFHALLYPVETPEGDKRPAFLRVGILEGNKRARYFRVPAMGPSTKVRVLDRLFVEMIYRVLLGPIDRRQSLYIPAARTGLMLALRAMISRSFESGDAPPTAGLPRPLTEFLRRLTYPRVEREDSKIGAWLQKEIMHGSIVASQDEVPSFTYVPENTEMSVPLHAASSMITELAPFLLLLNQGIVMPQIIFEEPEAHLHLSAQRSMARAIARLVNSGVKVLVTSHSDTFVQQINNLMHLHSHPQKLQLMKETGYEDSDLINPESAKAYEFIERKNMTDVVEVKREIEGFVVPTLNDTLINLAEETIALEEDSE